LKNCSDDCLVAEKMMEVSLIPCEQSVRWALLPATLLNAQTKVARFSRTTCADSPPSPGPTFFLLNSFPTRHNSPFLHIS
jgi:hypothetical protein